MNGYDLAAVVVVCVTAVVVTLLWALVRAGQRVGPPSGPGPVRMSDSEALRQRLGEAVQRAREGGVW